MLTYLARSLPTYLRARAAHGGPPISRLRRWVGPTQVDTNLHMNQAVYAQVMELGRLDLIVRTGAWARWQASGVNPVVADQSITYRRELKPFARFVVDTRCTAIEGRLLRVEHHLLVGDAVHATGVAHLIFIGPDGVLAPDAVPEHVQALIVAGLPVEDWRVAV